ncbi:MAG: DUF167 domain-containing protein [Candidatus Heimdallarchaeota archaeon]
MNLIKEKSDNLFILRIKVKPNSRLQEVKIDKESNFIKITLKSKPTQNKANIELLRLLKKRLKINSKQIQFISGLKSINKVIQIQFKDNIQKKEILNMLLD